MAQTQLAGLHRVAEMAAHGAPPDLVFTEVVGHASAVLEGAPAVALVRFEDDGSSLVLAAHGAGTPAGARAPAVGDSLAARVRSTGGPVRIDDFGGIDVRGVRAGWGVRAAVAVPVLVGDRPWGLLAATSGDAPLPQGTEERLGELTEVVAAAVAGAQAWSRLRVLAEEQAALRRVAELVARGGRQEELFAAVAAEASALVGAEVALARLDGERAVTLVAHHGRLAPVGTRIEVPPDDQGLISRILRTRRPARLDDYVETSGRAYARDDYGVRAGVGVPVVVDDRIWGVLAVLSAGSPVAHGVEQRLAQFADLMAVAIAGAQARADLEQLADEQRALRTVAELVARGVPPQEVFTAVAAQASGLLQGLPTTLTRFDGDDHLVVVASPEGPASPGQRIAVAPDTLPDWIRRGAPTARVDDYRLERDAALAEEFGLRAAAAAAVVVAGEVWGLLTTTSAVAALPAGAEDRLREFAELAGAAIANAENKAKLTASRARVVATADETRRRIQRDVHDGAQQRLVHTIVALKLARAQAAAGGDPGPLVEEALRNAERANRDLRDVVRGILPAALARGGLAAGLETLVGDVPLAVALRVPPGRFAPIPETTVYYVVAEALTNVVKHAGAGSAVVEVAVDRDRLVAEVRDDGAGGADTARGSGLIGLLDRVEAGGGTLTISSPAGGGTTVRAELPLAGPAGGTTPP